MGAAAPMIVPLVMSLAGTGMSMANQQETQHQQDKIAAEGIMRQGQLNDQSNQKVQALTKSISESDPQQQIDAQKATFTKALMSAAPDRAGANPVVPGASKKYSDALAKATGNVQQFGDTQSTLMAHADAPTLQRLQDQIHIGSTAGDLGLLQNQSVGQNAATQLGVKSIHPNPWIDAAGQAIRGAGQVYGSSAGAGAPAAADTSGGLDINQAPGASAYNSAYDNTTSPWGKYGR
jgi:hypothetical protein